MKRLLLTLIVVTIASYFVIARSKIDHNFFHTPC